MKKFLLIFLLLVCLPLCSCRKAETSPSDAQGDAPVFTPGSIAELPPAAEESNISPDTDSEEAVPGTMEDPLEAPGETGSSLEEVSELVSLFSRYGNSGRIPSYLGDGLYRDYCALMDTLYEGGSSVELTCCRTSDDFERLKNCVELMFLPKDLLRDPLFLTVTPFAFDEATGTVTVFYCWEDETLSPEELPCKSREEYLAKIGSFTDTVTDILEQCGAGKGTPADTALALFHWVSDTMDYEINRTYTAYTALSNHRGYCSIYAALYQFLAEQAGIPCLRICGAASAGWNDHEWNLVQLNGCWYHVDTTYQSSDSYAEGYYFGMSDSVCEVLGHGSVSAFRLSDELSRGMERPECTDTAFDSLYRSWLLQ